MDILKHNRRSGWRGAEHVDHSGIWQENSEPGAGKNFGDDFHLRFAQSARAEVLADHPAIRRAIGLGEILLRIGEAAFPE